MRLRPDQLTCKLISSLREVVDQDMIYDGAALPMLLGQCGAGRSIGVQQYQRLRGYRSFLGYQLSVGGTGITVTGCSTNQLPLTIIIMSAYLAPT